jgi:hypothetical protein
MTPLTAATGRDVAGLAGMHDHLRRPLDLVVGEGFAQPDLGRTRLVNPPGWWLAAGRVGQAETLAQLGAETPVAGAANSASVIGVELLAALDQGGIMVQLGAAVGAGWLGADRVAVENACAELAVATSSSAYGHVKMLPQP